MLITKTLILLLLIVICLVMLWRAFSLYLETILQYEKENNPEREEMINKTLRNLRFRLRCVTTILIIVMIVTPIILIKAFQ